MSSADDREYARIVMSARIITSVLASGVFIIGSILVYLVIDRGGNPMFVGDLPIVSIAAAAVFAVGLVSLPLIRASISAAQLKAIVSGNAPAGPNAPTTLAGRLASSWLAGMLVMFALLEGPSIFALIAFFLEVKWWVLAVPVAALAIMLANLPSEKGFLAWLDLQRTRLESMRDASRNGSGSA